MNPKRIAADFSVFAKGYLRNPIALFFSLIFPIILVGIFGVIFSSSTLNPVTLYVENQDHDSNASVAFLAALNQTHAVKINVVNTSGENLSVWLSDPTHTGGSVSAGLVIPLGFAVALQNHTPLALPLYLNPTDPSSSALVEGAVQGVANGVNLRQYGGTPILTPQVGTVGTRVLSSIDYLVPGLIGFSVLTSPMFSLVDISSTYKKEKLFRQLSLTPITKAEWLTSKILFYIGLSIISAVIMIVFGLVAFGAHVTITWEVLPFLVLGPLLFVSLGMLAGSVAPTPESAAVIGNIVTFPMMFLSGTFFPVRDFSPGLQLVAHALPLYYIIDGMNSVMLFSNPAATVTDLVIVLVIALVIFAAAVTFFKWREE